MRAQKVWNILVVAVACQTNSLKKSGTIHLKKRKGTDVYLLRGGEAKGLGVSKRNRNNNIKRVKFSNLLL